MTAPFFIFPQPITKGYYMLKGWSVCLVKKSDDDGFEIIKDPDVIPRIGECIILDNDTKSYTVVKVGYSYTNKIITVVLS